MLRYFCDNDNAEYDPANEHVVRTPTREAHCCGAACAIAVLQAA